MKKWHIVPASLPVSGEIVWVRINYWFGQPFLASYNSSDQSFVSVDNSLSYPVWSVMRWKEQ
jgi:hypothetical protein